MLNKLFSLNQSVPQADITNFCRSNTPIRYLMHLSRIKPKHCQNPRRSPHCCVPLTQNSNSGDRHQASHMYSNVRTPLFWDLTLNHWVITSLDPSTLEDEGITFPRNVRIQLPIDIASYSIRMESSATPMRKPQNLQTQIIETDTGPKPRVNSSCV